jgi:hypothetical protein
LILWTARYAIKKEFADLPVKQILSLKNGLHGRMQCYQEKLF